MHSRRPGRLTPWNLRLCANPQIIEQGRAPKRSPALHESLKSSKSSESGKLRSAKIRNLSRFEKLMHSHRFRDVRCPEIYAFAQARRTADAPKSPHSRAIFGTLNAPKPTSLRGFRRAERHKAAESAPSRHQAAASAASPPRSRSKLRKAAASPSRSRGNRRKSASKLMLAGASERRGLQGHQERRARRGPVLQQERGRSGRICRRGTCSAPFRPSPEGSCRTRGTCLLRCRRRRLQV